MIPKLSTVSKGSYVTLQETHICLQPARIDRKRNQMRVLKVDLSGDEVQGRFG